MTRLFISYATENRSTAAQLASILADRSWEVWWDRRLIPGSLFDEVIEEQLEEAQAVIVMWSTTSVASQWVRAEATAAVERGVMIPVMIEPCRIPLRFRNVQTIDLADWDGDPADSRIELLHEAVKAVTAGQPQESAIPPGSAAWRPQPDFEATNVETSPARSSAGRPFAWLGPWQVAALIALAASVAAVAYALGSSDGDSSAPADIGPTSATLADVDTEGSTPTQSQSTTVSLESDDSDTGDGDPHVGRRDGLDSGEWLYADDERRSADGRWLLLLQSDGNLVVEDEWNPADPPIWATGTSGYSGARAVMQPDGNFVIFDYSTGENRGPVYSTGTHDNPGATLTIQNDGAVVIRSRAGAQLFNSLVDSAER